MKIVLNKCHGGFGLSNKAILRYAEIKGITLYPYVRLWNWKLLNSPEYIPYDPEIHTEENRYTQGRDERIYFYTEKIEGLKEYWKKFFWEKDIMRDDPVLVQVVEEMGEEANGECADLRVEEINFNIKNFIDECDGYEYLRIR